MPLSPRRFRQIHLDFHTSQHIPKIGGSFDKKEWQETLQAAHVDSITCFSKCCHGWSYHPTKIGSTHPHLSFDLLRAQMDACKEINVAVPIYLTGGIDNLAAELHPEWLEIDAEGRRMGWAKKPTDSGFRKLCFHSPYTEFLCRQIEEAVELFPENDGVFIDVIYPTGCSCNYCMEIMQKEGLDPTKEADRMQVSQRGIEKYLKMTTEAAKSRNANNPIFHNSSVLRRGWQKYLPYFSHIELESLPTGGWGYDHFPLAAKYYSQLSYDYVGMTGKFHTTWGEFGGFKHPNALQYECAAMIAMGAKCSVGDQLHPSGKLDPSTYQIIGQAYAEVERREPWVLGAKQVADIALLSLAATKPDEGSEQDADTGAVRLLSEGKFLYDILDLEMPFEKYRLLILPDDITVTPELKARIDAYLAQGGRLLLSGKSGLDADGKPLFDIGADLEGPSPFTPDFIRPTAALAPSFCTSPMVMYLRSQRLRVTSGESLGDIFDPYFNRTWKQFSSHQHTPNQLEASGFSIGVKKGNIVYLAHPMFSLYRGNGGVALREHLTKVLLLALGDAPTVTTSMPSTARLTFTTQASQKRDVLHLLFAPTVNRGGPMNLHGGNLAVEMKSIEVIEDLVPLHDVAVSVKPTHKIARVTLEPEGQELPFTATTTGRIEFTVPKLVCHQIVALHQT